MHIGPPLEVAADVIYSSTPCLSGGQVLCNTRITLHNAVLKTVASSCPNDLEERAGSHHHLHSRSFLDQQLLSPPKVSLAKRQNIFDNTQPKTGILELT